MVMAFGLTNAPATFQQLMNIVLAPVLRKFALVFFNDILIYKKDLQEHITHLRQVFTLLQNNHLFAKMPKCTFAADQVEYLGHIIFAEGVVTDPKKIEVVVNLPEPENITELCCILGMANYYSRLIKDYGII